MQTSFYASGFLYNLKTQQILLLQKDQKENSEPVWSMLEGEGMEGEEAQKTFQRVISKSLNINLKSEDIYPVYDYFHRLRNKPHFVFYAEVKVAKKFTNLKKGNLSWFSFSESMKLPFNPQTKQDVVVGERVINAKWRDDEAKRNPETSVIRGNS